MQKISAFLRRKDIVFSPKRYFIDAMSAMAQGLFCTLLVGTILNTLGTQLHIGFLTDIIVTLGKGDGAVAYTIGGLCSAMVGPGMAVAIGQALNAPPMVLFSLIPVGFATNAMGGAGGPLAVLFVAIIASEIGKAVSKETKIDILVTPIVTILCGIGAAALIAAPIGTAASAVGKAIMWATELQPFFMGIIVSVVIGIALTLPISSAAICAALGLTGLAGRRRGRLLRSDGGLRRHELSGKPLGRPGGPGPGHQHAADGQHRPQSQNLDPAHLGLRHHRPYCHLHLPHGDERRCGVQRHGHLRSGGADRRVYRMVGGHRGRGQGRHHRYGLDRASAGMLRAACYLELAHCPAAAQVGLDRRGRLKAGSVRLQI